MGVIHDKKCEKTKTCQSGSTNDSVPHHSDSSILHRVSGVITFIAVGILLWLLGTSLSSPEGFQQAADIMDGFIVKFIMWGILTALAYHVIVGIRHMLMDFGYLEETFEAGQRSAKISFVITVVLSLLAGVLVW